MAGAQRRHPPVPALPLECIEPHLLKVAAVGRDADRSAAPRRARHLCERRLAKVTRAPRLILEPGNVPSQMLKECLAVLQRWSSPACVLRNEALDPEVGVAQDVALRTQAQRLTCTVRGIPPLEPLLPSSIVPLHESTVLFVGQGARRPGGPTDPTRSTRRPGGPTGTPGSTSLLVFLILATLDARHDRTLLEPQLVVRVVGKAVLLGAGSSSGERSSPGPGSCPWPSAGLPTPANAPGGVRRPGGPTDNLGGL